ncbi:DUF5665 domain-containing protein [Roseibacterium sp. SDUM158017]|uniref:DUF5665 domain-containing protein n=1 Tax=Roseicyclus salinarum TaxID=3036773 RepID=UPI00241541B3|nr:DUF5665 domain-containing protein [Roseibacterium sp. SDUM158017]MDG4647973.1 DUF5665 domain-containing protein [Roseibacterium sp. SDUM158017]
MKKKTDAKPDGDAAQVRGRDGTAADRPAGLDAEVRALREELAHLRRHRMFVIYQSVPRVLLLRFATGMAAGFGTVVGATLLLSVIVWALSQVEFVPIIGDWAVRISDEIEAALGNGN